MTFVSIKAEGTRPGPRLGQPDRPELPPRQGSHAACRRHAGPGMGDDFETGRGAARQSLRLPGKAGCHEQTRRAQLVRGQHEPPRGGKVIMFGETPNLADHGSGRGGFQRLFHRPEAFLRIACLDQDDALWIEPEPDEARRIGKPRLAQGLGLENPENGPHDRASASGLALPRKTCRESQSKTRGGSPIMRPPGDDLMQSPAGQAARQGTIEAAGSFARQMNGRLCWLPGPCRLATQGQAIACFSRFEKGDPRAQKIHPFRLAG